MNPVQMNPVQTLQKALIDFEKRVYKLFHAMAEDYKPEGSYSILCEVRYMIVSFEHAHARLKENKDDVLSKLIEAFIAQHFLLLQTVVTTKDLQRFIEDQFKGLQTADPWGELMGDLIEKAYLEHPPILFGTDLTTARSIYYAVLLSSVHTRDPQKTRDFLLRILSSLQESNTLELFEHAMKLLTEE